MLSLGLDPSLTGFGWCVHDSSQTGVMRVIARGHWKTSPREIFISRYMSLRTSVSSLLAGYPQIKIVGVESPPFGELWSEGLYGLFLYVNEAIYTHRRDVVYFDPGTVKFLTKEDPKVRKGKMFKSDMVDAARADTGGAGRWNHNEADAYLIARFAARFWMLRNGEIDTSNLTPAETHSFMRQHTFKKGKRAGETTKLGLVYREDDRFFCFSQLPESP